MARFADRAAAGREVGALVAERGVEDGAVVLGLPRGGVPVALEVAAVLNRAGGHALLDVLIVRKLRMPGQPELAFGAVASGGVRWLNEEVARHVAPSEIAARTAAQLAELQQREQTYRAGRAPLNLGRRTVVLVDDGIATGASVQAAVESARLLGAAKVIVAAPIAPPDAVRLLERVADRVDVVEVRRGFGAVSMLYDDFREVPDSTVADLLRHGAG